VEDVVTSGGSVLETAEAVRAANLKVDTAVVLLDREQGGKAMLAAQGITLHAVCTVTQVLDILTAEGRLSSEQAARVREFVGCVQFEPAPTKPPRSIASLPFNQRAAEATSPVARRLFEVMERKRSNLCVAADVTTAHELVALTRAVASEICCLKTHVDTLVDFSPSLISQLQELAVEHDFLLFEDRKFADIGNTVKLQYAQGVYQIAEWADIVTVHAVPGPGIIQGLAEVAGERCRGGLLLANMSSKGNLATASYADAAYSMAETYPSFIAGFIATQRHPSVAVGQVLMTPGVQLTEGKDTLGQQYLTPTEVVERRGCDVVIVGRGIYRAQDPTAAAKEYRDLAWSAYQRRCEADN